MYDVTLIIVNFFTSHTIKALIESLNALKILSKVQIVIINNSAPDDDLFYLSQLYSQIKIINSNTNLGFGRACNIGVENSHSEYVCFVNPDIVFIKDPFAEILKFLESAKKAGSIGGTLLNGDLSIQYSYNDFPGYMWEFSELLNFSKKLLKNKEKGIVRNEILKVDWVIGAFMFLSKRVFTEAGGFDSDFFLYYEDTDLQKRINNLGYQNYIIPNIRLIHGTKSSVEGSEGNVTYNLFMNKSKMIYFYKHSTFIKRNLVRIINLIRISSRIIIFPIKLLIKKSFIGDFKILLENFKIYLHFKKFYFK